VLRAFADVLTRAGEALRRVAEGESGAETPTAGGPPKHWADRVRPVAPQLLEPGPPFAGQPVDDVPHGVDRDVPAPTWPGARPSPVQHYFESEGVEPRAQAERPSGHAGTPAPPARGEQPAPLRRVLRRAGRAVEAAVEWIEAGRAVPSESRPPARSRELHAAETRAAEAWKPPRPARRRVRWPGARRRRREIPGRRPQASRHTRAETARPSRGRSHDAASTPAPPAPPPAPRQGPIPTDTPAPRQPQRRHAPAPRQSQRLGEPEPTPRTAAARTAAPFQPRPREPGHPWPALPGESAHSPVDDRWPELPDVPPPPTAEPAVALATQRRHRIDAEQRGA
jgi:hypothetical protein